MNRVKEDTKTLMKHWNVLPQQSATKGQGATVMEIIRRILRKSLRNIALRLAPYKEMIVVDMSLCLFFSDSKRECIERFGKEPNGRVVRDDDQICTTEYSKIVPLENGEVRNTEWEHKIVTMLNPVKCAKRRLLLQSDGDICV